MKKCKAKDKTKSIEDAILQQFPNAEIHEVRHNKLYGTRVLGVVPARNEYDKDHIVEWTEDGKATECIVSERDYRMVRWNEEEQKPEYVFTKILLHNEAFNVSVDASN